MGLKEKNDSAMKSIIITLQKLRDKLEQVKNEETKYFTVAYLKIVYRITTHLIQHTYCIRTELQLAQTNLLKYRLKAYRFRTYNVVIWKGHFAV